MRYHPKCHDSYLSRYSYLTNTCSDTSDICLHSGLLLAIASCRLGNHDAIVTHYRVMSSRYRKNDVTQSRRLLHVANYGLRLNSYLIRWTRSSDQSYWKLDCQTATVAAMIEWRCLESWIRRNVGKIVNLTSSLCILMRPFRRSLYFISLSKRL